MKESCANCRFWKGDEGRPYGWMVRASDGDIVTASGHRFRELDLHERYSACRAMSPQPYYDEGNERRSHLFPVTNANDWCGMWAGGAR